MLGPSFGYGGIRSTVLERIWCEGGKCNNAQEEMEWEMDCIADWGILDEQSGSVITAGTECMKERECWDK